MNPTSLLMSVKYFSMPFVFLATTIIVSACGGNVPTAAPPASATIIVPTIAPPTLAPTAVSTNIPKPTDTPAATATSVPPLVVKQIDTRPGVTLRFVLSMPSVPKGTLIMFPGGGGNGMFQVSGDKVTLGNVFNVRMTPNFVQQGFAAAIVDVPSDQPNGTSPAFRTSAEHAQDISKLINYLDGQGLKSVYLFGFSRGTLSAAYLSSALNDPRIKGVVLATTVTAAPHFNDIALSKITIPILVVHHHDDGCFESPFAGDAQMLKKMSDSSKVDFIEVNGGSPPKSEPCEALSQHGYFGIETPVVQAIADWINGKPAPPKIGP